MKEDTREDLFDPSLFTEDTRDLMLKGCKCTDCGKMFFPPRDRCPACLKSEMTPSPLNATGTIYSYTTVHIPSKNFKPPYTVGYVELKNSNVRVFGQIHFKQDQPLRIGMPMKMVIGHLWDEPDGRKMTGYYFEPEKN